MRSSHLLENCRASIVLSTVLLRIEFTAPFRLRTVGELLPRLSTLTSSSLASLNSGQPQVAGLNRFAASPLRNEASFNATRGEHDEAVYLCCTCPEVAFGGRYPLSLPCGARTFLTHRFSPRARGRLTYSPVNFTTRRWHLSTKSMLLDKFTPLKQTFLHKCKQLMYNNQK